MVLALLGNRAGANPTTPTQIQPVPTEKELTVLSPAVPTLSKLCRFLVYAETKLGVTGACNFELALDRRGYSPDILHLVSDSDLAEVEMSPGDIICLKAGFLKWWNGPDAKRKRDEKGNNSKLEQQQNKKICFERRYDGGGGWTFHAPAGSMVLGEEREAGSTVYYYCDAREEMVPVPDGYIVCQEDDDPFN